MTGFGDMIYEREEDITNHEGMILGALMVEKLQKSFEDVELPLEEIKKFRNSDDFR